MKNFFDLFRKKSGVIIGMCHVQALPGCPKNKLPMQKITDLTLKDAEIYMNAEIDGIIIENMHDVPYVQKQEIGPEIVAGMSHIATRLRENFPKVPLGVQVLTAGNKEAIAVAKCAGLNFIRCEGYVFSHVGDEGWIDANAGSLLRYRKMIDAADVLVFADIKKKHSSHQVTSDLTLADCAQAAEFFLADGVIVTGSSTGVAADKEELRITQRAVELPVLVGSGVTLDNVGDYLKASALIVGSHFKTDGVWYNPVCSNRVGSFMARVKSYQQ